MLDMASGPIPHAEYLEYSRGFNRRYCVDLSAPALKEAEAKIGEHGVFLHGDFFDLSFQDDFFDCAISLHTLYHIDRDRQEEAVRKLIRITRPKHPVIIVYCNPNDMLNLFPNLRKWIKANSHGYKNYPYYYTHPIEWWQRFSNVCSVEIFRTKTFDTATQRVLVPDGEIGCKCFDALMKLEDTFPAFFARMGHYYTVVLRRP